MKCKAAEVLHDKREQACGAEYGLIFLEFIDVTVSDQMMVQHGWRGKRLQWLYDTERHFLSDYISRYVADKGYVKDEHRGRREMTEAELASDAIEIVQEKIDAELAACGFVYDPDELIPVGWKNGWRRRSQSKAVLRMTWYVTNGGRASRLYLTSLLLMLHTERGFGAGRMRKLYDPVAEAIRWYIGKFFVGTDACDEEIRQRIAAIHKRIEACGVELVQVPAADAVTVRKKAAAVPAAPAEIPPELAGMDWETLINKQYEGGFCGKF